MQIKQEEKSHDEEMDTLRSLYQQMLVQVSQGYVGFRFCS